MTDPLLAKLRMGTQVPLFKLRMEAADRIEELQAAIKKERQCREPISKNSLG